MTTYSTGTATLAATGTAVTGAGTAWIAAGVRPGDLFWARGLSVRIAAVTSATALTLAYPWPGAALAGADYEIRWVAEEDRVLAAVNALIALLGNGNLAAIADLTASADKLPYFNGAGSAALTTITPAARALLDDTSTDDMLATLGALPAEGGTISGETATMLEVILAIRDARATTGGTPNFALAVNRQASPTPALMLGATDQNDGVIAANATDLRLGRHASNVFEETLRITSGGKLSGGGGIGAEGTIGSSVGGDGWSLGSRGEPGLLRLSRTSGGVAICNRDSNGALLVLRRSLADVGSITVSETGTSFNTASDHRLKSNVATIGVELDAAVIATLPPALAHVARLRPVTYGWTQHPGLSQETGFLAHELATEIPHAVTGSLNAVEPIGTAILGDIDLPEIPEAEAPDGAVWVQTGTRPIYQSADYGRITPDLTAGLQALTALVLDQAAELAALRALVEEHINQTPAEEE